MRVKICRWQGRWVRVNDARKCHSVLLISQAYVPLTRLYEHMTAATLRRNGAASISCSVRSCSCLLLMKCFAYNCTPANCIPRIVSYALTPTKNGSAPNPSQFRPPWAIRPVFVIVPSAMLTPLPTCSFPIATPRARIRERFHVVAALPHPRRVGNLRGIGQGNHPQEACSQHSGRAPSPHQWGY